MERERENQHSDGPKAAQTKTENKKVRVIEYGENKLQIKRPPTDKIKKYNAEGIFAIMLMIRDPKSFNGNKNI